MRDVDVQEDYEMLRNRMSEESCAEYEPIRNESRNGRLVLRARLS
jgi:hypothetical protein